MAGKLNIKDLQKEVAYRQQKNNEVYEKILSLVHKKILSTNEKSDDYCCIYKLPNFMYGFPIYDTHKCMEYLITKLSNNGFQIKLIDMSSIFISWRPTIQPQQTTIEYTPSQNAIQYNPYNFQAYPQLTSSKKTQNQYNSQIPQIQEKHYYDNNNDNNNNYSQMIENNIRTINSNSRKDKQMKTNVQFVDINTYQPSNEILF
jgi:hypothetical protein